MYYDRLEFQIFLSRKLKFSLSVAMERIEFIREEGEFV